MKQVNKLGRISEARSLLQEHKETGRGPFLLTRAFFPLELYLWGGGVCNTKNSLQREKLKLGYGIISSSLGFGGTKII